MELISAPQNSYVPKSNQTHIEDLETAIPINNSNMILNSYSRSKIILSKSINFTPTESSQPKQQKENNSRR